MAFRSNRLATRHRRVISNSPGRARQELPRRLRRPRHDVRLIHV